MPCVVVVVAADGDGNNVHLNNFVTILLKLCSPLTENEIVVDRSTVNVRIWIRSDENEHLCRFVC